MNKEIIFDRIVELLEKNNVDKQDLCKALGVSPSNFGNWASRRNTSYTKYLYQIADFFNVPVDYLLGNTDEKENIPNENNLAEDEKIMLEKFRGYSQEKRAALLNLLDQD